MNAARLTERHVRLRRHAGRPLQGRARPGQHRRQRDLLRHERLGAGRRRRPGQARGRGDGQGRLLARLLRRALLDLGDHRPDHPALDPDGALRRRLRHLDRLSCSWAASSPASCSPPAQAARRRRRSPAPATSRSSRRRRCARRSAITLDSAPVAHACPSSCSAASTPARSRRPRPPRSPPSARCCWRSSGIARSRSPQFYDVLVESAKATGMVALTIAGALVMNWIVAAEQIPDGDGRLDDRASTSRPRSSCSSSPSSSSCSAPSSTRC